MPPKPQHRDAFELFQSHFDQLHNPAHELVQLAQKIDWDRFEAAFAGGHPRTRRCLRKLRTYVGRLIRDIRRNTSHPDEALATLLARADRVRQQQPHDTHKLLRRLAAALMRRLGFAIWNAGRLQRCCRSARR